MEFVNHLTDKLWFAVPKKGRLNQAVLDLLSGADIQFRRDHRLDIALVKNLPIALIFLPAADIPIFVGEGKCSLGITGWDQIAEYESSEDTQENIAELLDLRFGKCLLQVQIPENGPLQEPEQLIGKTICTSFPNLTEAYFRQLEAEVDTLHGVENGISSFEKLSLANGMSNGTKNSETKVMGQSKLRTRIKELSGSVEAACALGVADGIVDLVESGETMRAAGLKPISTVLSSRAVLITSKKPSYPQLVELIAARIRGVVNAKRYVLCTYNIERKNLDHACKVTPGRRAPTIMPLEDEGWVAVSAMVERENQALTMDELIKLGADDIMINTISNTRTQ